MKTLLLYLLLQNVTYEANVKPIFEQRCARCHSTGSLNWMKYDNAFLYKDSIRWRVWAVRNMPPDFSITEEERNTIKEWVDQGARQ